MLNKNHIDFYRKTPILNIKPIYNHVSKRTTSACVSTCFKERENGRRVMDKLQIEKKGQKESERLKRMEM